MSTGSRQNLPLQNNGISTNNLTKVCIRNALLDSLERVYAFLTIFFSIKVRFSFKLWWLTGEIINWKLRKWMGVYIGFEKRCDQNEHSFSLFRFIQNAGTLHEYSIFMFTIHLFNWIHPPFEERGYLNQYMTCTQSFTLQLTVFDQIIIQIKDINLK